MTTKPSRNFLVVDDEPEILSEMASYLRRRGEAVVTATSFEQGLGIVADDTVPIDILITDGRMPDGSGLDLLKAAVGQAGGPQLLVMMTGHFEKSDLSDDLREAGVVIVYKPFSLGSLYRELGAAWAAICPSAPVTGPAPALACAAA